MTETTKKNEPLRILVAALGGEGGGVLMNWIVQAARAAGMATQATSVPGVAQRTGSTSYYIEVADSDTMANAVFALVPMPGRVDVLVSSELVETARAIAAGFVSPNCTTLVSSTARTYSTAEKIDMGDGRYAPENVKRAAEGVARECFMLDLEKLATDNGTFVSATMFGALAGTGALPWSAEISRSVLGDGKSAQASKAGFDAARDAVLKLRDPAQDDAVQPDQQELHDELSDLPEEIAEVLATGEQRCVDFQDERYGKSFRERATRLIRAANLNNEHARMAVQEGCRRLALWMAYEDVARVADLKTRPERFERIRNEAKAEPGMLLTVTEYMKPRAEEIADILPSALGKRIMARVERGGGFPFLGRGIHIRSNGPIGFWMLKTVAGLRRIRRSSYRFRLEQEAIEEWLSYLEGALQKAPEFAAALAELPRVLKGYSDTLVRGRHAYAVIMSKVVRPAFEAGREPETGQLLRDVISAALADDTHAQLNTKLSAAPALTSANRTVSA